MTKPPLDLSNYVGMTVEILFHVISDVGWSDEDGGYDSDGAYRIDWVEVSGHSRDDFTTGYDGWESVANLFELTIMQGYDLAFYGHQLDNGYNPLWGFETGLSYSNWNQGYTDTEFDALIEELESLQIDWNENYPNPPDLSNSDGERALEILHDLQITWAENCPNFVLFNRVDWQNYGWNGFPDVPINFNNEHLAKSAVRQAINLALDRQSIIDVYGYDPPIETCAVDSWLAPWHPGFDPISYPEYDILAARQLLFDAGYENVIVTDSIIKTIESYIDSGVIKTGAAKSLITKIDSAADLINMDNYHAAIQKLNDFIDQVRALIRSERILTEDGEQLIALAQEIIDLLVDT